MFYVGHRSEAKGYDNLTLAAGAAAAYERLNPNALAVVKYSPARQEFLVAVYRGGPTHAYIREKRREE
jgi:hypothetical protein